MEAIQFDKAQYRQTAPQPKSVPTETAQYLSFSLGTDAYAVDIMRVQEIRSYEVPTGVRNAPSFVKGVINLRGVVVPIIDLRVKLKLPEAHYSPYTVVVVFNVMGTVIGAVVDAVHEVVTISSAQVKPAVRYSGVIDPRFVAGQTQLDGHPLTLVNIAAMLSRNEIGVMSKAA